MLILQRKIGQSLCLGDDIEITVVSIESGRVRLAIDAPKSLSILRSELKTAIHANRDAAVEQVQPIDLLDYLGQIGLGGAPPPERDAEEPF